MMQALAAPGAAGPVAGATPEGVRQATVEAMERHQCDHYTRRPGLAALCQRVAGLLAARGVDVDGGSGVIITGSVQEARFVTLRALAEDKTVYLPLAVPATPYAAGIDFAGARLEAIAADGDLPAVAGGLLIVPDPDPATGRPMAGATLQRLAAWAAAGDLVVVVDATLASPLAPDAAPLSLAAWPETASRTVVLGSFATPGLAAWQVSWVAGPASLVTAVRDMKQAMTICTPAPGQYAALAGLAEPAGPTGRDER